jgi:hypothetical protein
MNLKLDAVERRVVKALRTLRWRSSHPKHTKLVKQAIATVGDKMRLSVFTTDQCDDHDCEWLYDLCWCKQDDDDRIVEMPLVMECEWAQGYWDILADFQKLLVARSDHRVFICSLSTSEDWNDCVDYLIEQVRLYSGTRNGDRYLFGRWTSDGWHFRQYIHPTAPVVVERVWLFQATKDYDLVRELKRRKRDYWTVKRHRDYLRPGNIVLLWQSGSEAGIYGLGELTSKAWEEKGSWYADMCYSELLNQPILKSKLVEHASLRNLGIIAMPHAANPYRVCDSEWQALKKLLHKQTS